MSTVVRNVLNRYRNYLKTHYVEDYIIEEFLETEAFIDDLLHRGELENAVRETASLFEYLEEHRAVNPRTEYPGPGIEFKQLVFEIDRV